MLACLQLLTGPHCEHSVTVWCPHTPVLWQMDSSQDVLCGYWPVKNIEMVFFAVCLSAVLLVEGEMN